MDFALTDDQMLLNDMIGRLLEEPDTAERWASFANLGLLSMGFPSAHGGSDLGAAETFLLARRLGQAGELSPYLSAIVGAGLLLAGTEAGGRRLGAIAAGELRPTLALDEAGDDWDALAPKTRATRAGDGYRLDGTKRLVLDAESADMFITSAALDEGVALFLVPSSAVTILGHATLDGGRAAEVRFHGAMLGSDGLLAGPEAAPALIAAALDRINAALAAEAAGLTERLVGLTREHVTTRTQFRQPLSKFQVLQHRLVDMWIESQLILSAAGAAAMAIDALDGPERRRLVSAAKVTACKGGRLVAEQAIQLHGAMGMTDECTVAPAARRLTMIARMFGDERDHLDAFVSAG